MTRLEHKIKLKKRLSRALKQIPKAIDDRTTVDVTNNRGNTHMEVRPDRMKAFLRAQAENLEARKAERELKEREINERAQARREQIHKRQETRRKLNRRTDKGQPILANHVENLL